MIPYGHQSVSAQDVEAVLDVLQSDWLTQGPAVGRFEERVARYCGASSAVAFSSGTAALHVACLAAGLGTGDWLWTSPNSFVASANCGLYCGAQVDFVDIDPRTYNMDMDALEQKLTHAEVEGRLPKVVVPVHFAGQSCEMERLNEFSKQYGFVVLEDASHAIGGSYKESKVGSCRYSDMTVFSFHPVKVITSAEGGMVTTNSKSLYDKLVTLRTHGIVREPDVLQFQSHGPWYYEQQTLGYNYRLSDLHAALGASQMDRLDEFVTRRHELVERYNHAFRDLCVVLPWLHPDARSTWHLYVLRINPGECKIGRRELFEYLKNKGIGVNVHYIPVHLQPYYRGLGFKQGDYPQAERYYSEAITLPLYSGLSRRDQDYVIETLDKALA